MNDKPMQMAEAFRHLDPTQQLAEGLSSGFSRIAYKGKNWALLHQGDRYQFVRADDGTQLPYIDVVIVGANPRTSKNYYEGTYNEDAADAPDCSSLDGIVPDAAAPNPQSEACATCVHNQWLPNRQGKECQDHRRLAVLLLPYMKTKPAMDAPLLEPVFFKVPPASLKAYKAYSDSLSHKGMHWASVVTRISFDPNKLFQMTFELKQPLTNAEAPLVLPLMEDHQTQMLIGAQPQVRQIAAPVKKEERQETGLMAAFGGQQGGTVTALPATKRSPAKSEEQPKAKNKAPAKVIDAVKNETPVDASPAQPHDADVEEADAELDDAIDGVLSKKLSEMLK